MTRTRVPRTPAAATPTAAPSSAWLQPKLSIGAPGDQHEQEADQAAERVMQGSGRPALTPLRAPAVQRDDEEAKKKKEPDPAGDGLAAVAANLGENNPAFGVFTEKLAADFMAHPPELSVGVPVFLGANYAFLWSMAMVNPAMRRNFDDFNLAMLPGIVPQFPVKTFTYRILDSAQTRFEFDFGLDGSSLLEAFNDGVLNTHLSSLKLDTSGRFGGAPLSLSALQVQLGLFSDGINLSGGFRNGISPYPLIEPGGSVMTQTPAMPDLQAGRQDVRFTLNLDLVRLYQHFNPGKPNPLGPQIDVARDAAQPTQGPGAHESSPAAAAAVQSTLAEGGAPLEPSTRQFMESRFGHDFGHVRVHADAQAASSAQSVGARAYTVGSDLVFNRGQYQPATPAGRHLLAHELAHVVQQAGGAQPLMQRKLDVEDFDAGSFSLPTLKAYLAKVGPGRIEDKGDSDDKARAIVAQWRKGTMQLDAAQKIALIQEMQSGFTGNDDERAILTLLLNTPEAELPLLFAAKGGLDPEDLDSDFQGPEEDALRAFYDKNFIGGRKAALKGSRSLRTAKADEPAVTAPAGKGTAADTAPQGPPRKDYVFIMGDVKKDAFYREAFKYFTAHRPTATFVTDKRSLAAVLSHVASQISEPIGNLYLVSHANEDGTLSFGLDGDDKDKKLNVTELRKALRPAGGGGSALSKVGKQVDARTVVRIKGCDIGRTKEMLDLLDEAFGGVGTVTAPTHEQEYGTDPTLGKRADAAFRAEVQANHPEPAAVDTKNLKGPELKAAKAERAKAMAERKLAIAAELKEREPERKTRVAQAQQYEAFSGPMFQRPGEQLFTKKELLPELESLYGHLSGKQRSALADKLVARDTRPESVALKNGTYQQKGQRLYRRVIAQTHWDPQGPPGFLALYRSVGGKTGKGFQPETLSSSPSTGKEGQPQLTYRLTGSLANGGSEFHELSADVVPDDATYLATAKGTLNNPGRYDWTQERTNNPKTGKTTLKAVAKRVLAYLHHGELDAAAHQHFNRAEPDADFYAKSTFAPPPAKPKPKP